MKWEVWRYERDRQADLIWRGRARSAPAALRAAGYRPDRVMGRETETCGAEPRNEYGMPWYPHIAAYRKREW